MLSGRGIPLLFSYVGQKRGLIECYPPPKHGLIVEPFAGSAGYARRWGADRDVLLVEKSPQVARMWKWLVRAEPDEIMSLPLLQDIPGMDLRCADGISAEARIFIGMNIGYGIAPRHTPSSMAVSNCRSGTLQWWNESSRRATAEAVVRMRGWEVLCGDYSLAPNVRATWFVDPPYARLSDMYGHMVDDYDELGRWCRKRRGQIIVCEDMDALWLPFVALPTEKRSVRASGGTGAKLGQGGLHREGVWIREW